MFYYFAEIMDVDSEFYLVLAIPLFLYGLMTTIMANVVDSDDDRKSKRRTIPIIIGVKNSLILNICLFTISTILIYGIIFMYFPQSIFIIPISIVFLTATILRLLKFKSFTGQKPVIMKVFGTIPLILNLTIIIAMVIS